jgi:hypothetical protein
LAQAQAQLDAAKKALDENPDSQGAQDVVNYW